MSTEKPSNDNADFTALHSAMKAMVEAQDRAGWQSPEVERLSKRILQGLWVCANNEPPLPRAVFDGLAQDMADLERAKQA